MKNKIPVKSCCDTYLGKVLMDITSTIPFLGKGNCLLYIHNNKSPTIMSGKMLLAKGNIKVDEERLYDDKEEHM